MGDEEKKKKKKKKKKQSKKEDDDITNFFSAFTCAQLRKRLGNLGLKQGGLKSELVARLCEFDRVLAAAGADEYEGLTAEFNNRCHYRRRRSCRRRCRRRRRTPTHYS